MIVSKARGLYEEIRSFGTATTEDHLAIARVSQPRSKLATVSYLKSYYDEDLDLNQIYRYMDKLYSTQRELVQQISVEHTQKVLGGKIGLLVSEGGYPLSYSRF